MPMDMDETDLRKELLLSFVAVAASASAPTNPKTSVAGMDHRNELLGAFPCRWLVV